MFPSQVHQEKNIKSASGFFSSFLCFQIRVIEGLTKSAKLLIIWKLWEILPAIARILKSRASVILQPFVNRDQTCWTVSLGRKEGEEVLQNCTCTCRGYRGFISSMRHESKARGGSWMLSVVESLNPFAVALFSIPFTSHKELSKLWAPATEFNLMARW